MLSSKARRSKRGGMNLELKSQSSEGGMKLSDSGLSQARQSKGGEMYFETKEVKAPKGERN